MTASMNLTEFARHMGVSRPTAYKIVRSVGFPPPLCLDGAPRWSVAAIEEWLALSGAPDVVASAAE
jgi:predicted DNA-binding transcriptional regulator AlpA